MTEQDNKGLFGRLRQGLTRTSTNLTDGLGDALLGKVKLDDEVLEEIETRLLTSDVGIEATNIILADIGNHLKRSQSDQPNALRHALVQSMVNILEPSEDPLDIFREEKPFVMLVVGINGAGKTTTIGKLANKFSQAGNKVMLAAGDTFRAAAVEQLQTWGERNNVTVVAQQSGSDSASVCFDAMESARAKQANLLIADTAGRLHTQSNLMDELKKVKRVISKVDDSAPHETLLVLDGGTGQNAIKQAEEFHKEIGVTGLAITKLDGTAKGGVLFAIASKLGLPIRFIGVGEQLEDLRPFVARDFVNALLSVDD